MINRIHRGQSLINLTFVWINWTLTLIVFNRVLTSDFNWGQTPNNHKSFEGAAFAVWRHLLCGAALAVGSAARPARVAQLAREARL